MFIIIFPERGKRMKPRFPLLVGMVCYCSGAAIIAQEQEQQLPKLQQELAPGSTIASKRKCLLARYVTFALHSTYELVLIFMVHLNI